MDGEEVFTLKNLTELYIRKFSNSNVITSSRLKEKTEAEIQNPAYISPFKGQ